MSSDEDEPTLNPFQHHTTNVPLALTTSVLGLLTKRIKTLTPEGIKKANAFFKSIVGKHIRASVYFIDGQPFRFQPTIFERGLKKFLKTHNFLVMPRTRQYDRIDYSYYAQEPDTRLMDFKPAYIGVVTFKGKKATIEQIAHATTPKMPPMLITRAASGEWMWILGRAPMKHCVNCGRAWVYTHNCNEKRSAFFYHAVDKKGRQLWQHVPFRSPAQPSNVKQLLVTYDIETYTIFEARGKRMHPFMLCFMLSGDEMLVEKASRIALRDETVKQFNGGFYWINSKPGQVALQFRNFRTRLQTYFARDLVRRFYAHNKEYFKHVMNQNGYRTIYDVPFDLIQTPIDDQIVNIPKDFDVTNIIIIGHNICKFDELLLATELVEDRHIFPAAVKCERSFMPRVGRLLFNDIHFHLPNPLYLKKDPARVARWSEGIVTIEDLRYLSVRFLVRDTLQLTSGVKLKTAAAAYSLDLSKGECPYQAINEFISTGTFEADDDGFPVVSYWQDETVLAEQKQLWQDTHPSQRYDLIQACLEYCMLDVAVTQRLAHTLHTNYDQYFRNQLDMKGTYNIFDKPTIPSNTHAFWKQLTFSKYVKDAQQKIITGKRSNKRIPADYVAELYAPYRTMFSYIRQALRGGRCYPTVLGPYLKPVYVFDICGMYASALTHPMPHGPPLDPDFTAKHVDVLNKILSTERPVSYFDKRIKPSILKIDATPPDIHDIDPLPPICSRRGGRLVWTNERLDEEVITIIDIITLHNRGWTVRVLQDEFNIVFPEWQTLCADYVSINIAAKEKADKEKNEVLRSISKMLSNALYGAFATNMDTTKIVFEQDLTEEDKELLFEGRLVVKHVTLLNDKSFSGKYIEGNAMEDSSKLAPYFSSPLCRSNDDDEEEPARVLSKAEDALTSKADLSDVDLELEDALESGAFISSDEDDSSAHFSRAAETVFKPMRLLDATAEALTVLHLENLDQMVENKRYATQIACFVLGWSRAFFSEWAEILHGPDKGVHIHERAPQSLYGDTDSIFVTASGYERMITRGAHRIKKPGIRLTFDPENPQLYWACECDIKCKKCGSDTFSSESVFLAPKLYGLKDAHCINPDCGHVGQGKLRSKGHNKEELVYDTLIKCWERYESELYGGFTDEPAMHTTRTIFKTTLLNKVSKYEPFTIHNEPLTRILRPWKDPTLYQHGDFLYPYDSIHPNPRTENDIRLVEDFAEGEQPLRLYPEFNLDDCDEILAALGDGDEEESMDL